MKIAQLSEFEVAFFCPGCRTQHNVRIGQGSAWLWNGSMSSPTFSPSILVQSGHYAPGWTGPNCWCTFNRSNPDQKVFCCERCHSFVRNGKIEFLSDCSHDLAGKTVELPDWK